MTTQVKELIRLVEPEVVGVELCKDRIPLLIDTENDNSPNIWHCRRVSEFSVAFGAACVL